MNNVIVLLSKWQAAHPLRFWQMLGREDGSVWLQVGMVDEEQARLRVVDVIWTAVQLETAAFDIMLVDAEAAIKKLEKDSQLQSKPLGQPLCSA